MSMSLWLVPRRVRFWLVTSKSKHRKTYSYKPRHTKKERMRQVQNVLNARATHILTATTRPVHLICEAELQQGRSSLLACKRSVRGWCVSTAPFLAASSPSPAWRGWNCSLSPASTGTATPRWLARRERTYTPSSPPDLGMETCC